MKSLIIIEVEHGETTDPVNQFIDEAHDLAFNVPDLTVKDYTVRVDLPEHVTLNKHCGHDACHQRQLCVYI